MYRFYLIGDEWHVAIFTKEDQQLIVRRHGKFVKVSLFSSYDINKDCTSNVLPRQNLAGGVVCKGALTFFFFCMCPIPTKLH